jgi:hypothetical protein
MSITENMPRTALQTSAPPPADPNHYSRLFAEAVRRRREELGFSIAYAAHLAGLTVFEWLAIECATLIPMYPHELRPMAEALQVNYDKLFLSALVASMKQNKD